MRRIADQTLLLFYCLTSLFIVKANMAVVVAMLIAVIYSSASFFIKSHFICILLTIVYLCSGCFFPLLYLFLPLIIYHAAKSTVLLIATFTAGAFLCFLTLHSGSLLLLLLLGGLFAYSFYLHTSRYEYLDAKFRKTRDDSAELNLLLNEKNQALLDKQDYEIYAATLHERNRIAREIHDNVGHMLSRSILMTGALKAVNPNPTLDHSLLQLSETLNEAMSSIRNSVHDLHDESIDLKEALQGLVDAFTFCSLNLEYDMGYDLPRSIKYSFISIVKEALNNILRHSCATHVQLIVREHPGLYQLKIEDNGIINGPLSDSGLGLINMKDRVTSLDGTIQFQTNHGFCIFITIPKKEAVQ